MKHLRLWVVFAMIAGTGAPAFAARCTGDANCTACTNCSSCKHCSKSGGSCGVCRSASPAIAPRSAPAAPVIVEDARPYFNNDVTHSEPSWIRQQRLQQRMMGSASTPKPSRAQRQSARYVTTPARFTGKVVGVADGDTITVLFQNQPLRIRLYGIDAPEKAQPYGQQAKQFLSTQVFGKVVTVYSKGQDRYGRTLGWVFLGSEPVNARLVGRGLAWHYRQYAPRESKLAQIEQTARAQKIGLWQDVAPTAPWDWRRK